MRKLISRQKWTKEDYLLWYLIESERAIRSTSVLLISYPKLFSSEACKFLLAYFAAHVGIRLFPVKPTKQALTSDPWPFLILF